MSTISSKYPCSVPSINAKSIRTGSQPPTTKPSIDSSLEGQKQLAIEHPARSAAIQLLQALWQSPDRHHQIGILDQQKDKFINHPVADAADAATQAQRLSSEGAEVYFACAEYLTPQNRTSDNAAGACAFWMDIDCGEDKASAGKGYATVEDAISALDDFCSDTGLPQPTHFVHSGSGLHLYWALDDTVSRHDWQSYARKLKELTKASRFLADGSRTADIASVLRVPGTLNHKYSPPRPVALKYESTPLIECSVMLAAISGAHSRLCDAVATRPLSLPSIAVTTTTDSYTTDASKYGAPDLKRLTSALATLDPDCDEETWKLRRLAPLALEARKHPESSSALYELARSWSSGELGGQPSKAWVTPGGNGLTGKQAFDDVWLRFLNTLYTGTPVTLRTIFYDAKLNDWDYEEQFQKVGCADEEDA